MLLIYSHTISPRLTYIFKHLLSRILGLEIGFTSTIEEFIAHEGMKLSYTRQALGNELFIKSNDLLFDQGIDYLDIHVQDWDGVPCFFLTQPQGEVPFDIFAASFYLISRYEEYLPHVKDQHERYPATESLAFQHKFLDKPVIDIWAYRFRDILKENFPGQSWDSMPKRRFEYLSTLDIDQAFQFKHKGFTRNVGGIIKDLLRFNLRDLWMRFLVIVNLRRDPFDVFEYAIGLQQKHKVKTIFFFLLGEYSTYDKNISPDNSNFKQVIKNIADYSSVGIHPSYYSMKNEAKTQKETKTLEGIVNFPIRKSRQHFLRMELPETYQNLVDLEIKSDYTMGYASHYGFRAGTCSPFYFYDLDFEIQTPLKVHPFAAMDGTLKDYLGFTPKRAYNTIMHLANEVRKVEGTLITVFHNESISGSGRWRGWSRLYESLLREMAKLNANKEATT